MTPATIAALCGFAFSPPSAYDTMPLPPAARVVEVAAGQLDALCVGTPHLAAGQRNGCTVGQVAYVPTWNTWHGTRACWVENRRHEEAHLKGWTHP